jgi:uncharacterized protein (DUF983 family)
MLRHYTSPENARVQKANEHPLKPAIMNGWRRRCPSCGTGPMFKSYLKLHDACPVCEEELHHARADDGPAYLTILIVGHILAPSIHIFYVTLRPDPLVMASVFSVGTVALSLYLLPRLKGFMVGFQWAKRMHGFEPQKERFADPADRPEPDNIVAEPGE